uniref:DUF4219 domain-containing protein/UBN2 domain-containing protein n=1 Tax=Tanacetum cinerariifolium TaxID=118510 RepID=A0A6L2JDX3_TANCI|nr:DUF4219 domain-containing protein/UBN2 domain-containing protein [Tanacetum cinerariifolium]
MKTFIPDTTFLTKRQKQERSLLGGIGTTAPRYIWDRLQMTVRFAGYKYCTISGRKTYLFARIFPVFFLSLNTFFLSLNLLITNLFDLVSSDLISSSHLSSPSSEREEYSYLPRNELLFSDLSSLLLKGQSMQTPSLFESDSFIYRKNRFETYVKSNYLDLWDIITNGDFQPIQQNPKTKLDEVIPFGKQSDDLKKKLAKNNEAKMVIYNALPRKEYERVFMCNTKKKEIWKTLLITHEGNNQVKDNKIDLLVQQYEQFVISEDKSIDSAFARFNTIITGLKALDEARDSEIVKAKGERKSLSSSVKKESSDEEFLTFGSEDEEYVMAVRDFKKFFKRRGRFMRQPQNDKKMFQRSRDDKNGKGDRKCFRCGDPNHLIGESLKPPKDKNQRDFVRGSWSDSGEEDDEKVKDKTCLVAQASSDVCYESSYFSDENSSIDDLVLVNEYDKLCKMSLKIITKNK